jgi:hypothetical protein
MASQQLKMASQATEKDAWKETIPLTDSIYKSICMNARQLDYLSLQRALVIRDSVLYSTVGLIPYC